MKFELRQFLDRSFLISIRESFIALLPFILINSFLSLIIALLDIGMPTWQGSAFHQGISFFRCNFQRFFHYLH